MNKRQKIFVTGTVLLIVAVVVAPALLQQPKITETDKLKIVVTFYPLAFFAQEIGGDQVSVKQLIPDNTEVHNWQPSTQDILAVQKADVLLYNGASLDHWFEEDILSITDLHEKLVLETTEGLELLETSHKDDASKSAHDPEGTYDPHTWVSPTVAKLQAENIYHALVQKDPENTDYYAERWQILESKFNELDASYLSELADKQKSEIFVSHSAFGYLAHDYGFEQNGVIGISADEQPSASTYTHLVEMMLERQTYVVYVDPVYSEESALTLKSELERLSGQDVQILKLYFMLGEIDGLEYFDQQEQNLVNLKIGLDS